VTDRPTIPQPRCVVCTNEIPTDRARISVTCSKECGDIRHAWRRARQEMKRCRYCLAPSSPLERMRYQRWRRYERAHPPAPEDLSPEEARAQAKPQEETEDHAAE
jgi:predicted nucleic acid-binding Zn ribbon protein